MSFRICAGVSVSMALLLVGGPLFAEGRGHGLNRALAAAARGSSNSGLARAGQSAARSGSGISGSSANVGRSANGLNPAAAGMQHGQSDAAQASNFARIRDNRLQQADHLRQISERNGNARLGSTADRMEQSAQTNYSRQIGETNAEGPANQAGSDTAPDSAGSARSATSDSSSFPPARTTRSSWLPAWMRTSR